MQLNRKRPRRISLALGLLTANLLSATAALAAEGDTPPSDVANELGMTRIDAAVLFYQEAGGRVKATEPVISGTLNATNGDILTAKFTSDILTGATPNGAAPWSGTQTFTTPAHSPGKTVSVTGSSGNSTLVTIPGTGVIARQYTAAAHALPVDSGFKDQRFAGDIGYSTLWDPDTRLSGGLSASTERDYSAYTVNAGISRDLNHKNTTVSLGLNFEYDLSKPFFGTPSPLTVMSADAKGGNAQKTVMGLVAGVTQVLNRYWLTQLSYSIGESAGYQTDPYRILSVVDPVTGGPLKYLYESRPRNRLRQSLYWGNKIALGPTYVDASARVYQDSWGVKSVTAALADRIPLGSWLYVEPQARYYQQTAANFFTNYLVSGQALPSFASSDSRLSDFHAITYGGKVGLKFTPTSELYVQGEHYKQSGNNHPAGAIGDLATENLFSGVSATSVIVGFTFGFY